MRGPSRYCLNGRPIGLYPRQVRLADVRWWTLGRALGADYIQTLDPGDATASHRRSSELNRYTGLFMPLLLRLGADCSAAMQGVELLRTEDRCPRSVDICCEARTEATANRKHMQAHRGPVQTRDGTVRQCRVGRATCVDRMLRWQVAQLFGGVARFTLMNISAPDLHRDGRPPRCIAAARVAAACVVSCKLLPPNSRRI